jgi:hypothetical protein
MPTFINDSADCLQFKILRGGEVHRERFNPIDEKHLKSYQKFLSTGNWDGVQFYCEFPYTTVPETVSRIFATHQLNSLLKG